MSRVFTLLRIFPCSAFAALTLILALRPGVVSAHWLEQNAGFSSPGLHVFSMDAVDENIAWAVALEFPSPRLIRSSREPRTADQHQYGVSLRRQRLCSSLHLSRERVDCLGGVE